MSSVREENIVKDIHANGGPCVHCGGHVSWWGYVDGSAVWAHPGCQNVYQAKKMEI